MEIRDVFPSQSQVTVPRPADPAGASFARMMKERKAEVSTVSRGEVRGNSQENPAKVASLKPETAARVRVHRKQDAEPEAEAVTPQREAVQSSQETTALSEAEKPKPEAEMETAENEEAEISALPHFSQQEVPMSISMAEVAEVEREAEAANAVHETTEEPEALGENAGKSDRRIPLKQILDVYGYAGGASDHVNPESILEKGPAASLSVEASGDENPVAASEIRAGMISDLSKNVDMPEATDGSEVSEGAKQKTLTPERHSEQTADFVVKDEQTALPGKRVQDLESAVNRFSQNERPAPKKEGEQALYVPTFAKSEAVQHHNMMVQRAEQPVLQQLDRAFAANVKILSNGQAIEVQLTPEHLGKVTMKLEYKAGEMVAGIKVENADVKNLLEGSLQELRESLTQKGIVVKEIHVSVSKDDHRGGQEFTGNQRNDREEDAETQKEFRLEDPSESREGGVQ